MFDLFWNLPEFFVRCFLWCFSFQPFMILCRVCWRSWLPSWPLLCYCFGDGGSRQPWPSRFWRICTMALMNSNAKNLWEGMVFERLTSQRLLKNIENWMFTNKRMIIYQYILDFFDHIAKYVMVVHMVLVGNHRNWLSCHPCISSPLPERGQRPLPHVEVAYPPLHDVEVLEILWLGSTNSDH